MAVTKKQTGVFTRGGKRVNDMASAIAGAINNSQTPPPNIKYPQPGDYDIIGQPSYNDLEINVGNTGQDLGVKDTTNDLLAKYLASNSGSGVNPGIQQATNATLANLNTGGYAAGYQPVMDYLTGQQTNYQNQLNTGAYKDPTNALNKELERQYGVAGKNIDTSNLALMDFLNKQTNPFANISAQTTTVDPQFNALLEQQGVSTAPVIAQYEAQKQAAMDSGAQFQNLTNILKGLFDQGLVDSKTAASLSKDFATQNLEANKAFYGTQISAKETENKQATQDLLDKTMADIAKTNSDIANARGGVQDSLLKLLTAGGKAKKPAIKRAFSGKK
jgi:hypothetical protein